MRAAQGAGAGHVIGVHVRIEDDRQLEPELAEEPEIALDVLDDGIDEGGLAASFVTDEVREGRRLLVEELTEDHVAAFASCASCAS